MTSVIDRTTYFVTDIESDGPDPARNSMLAFATVAVRLEDGIVDRFEAVLSPRPDRVQDPRTMAWWATEPEAHALATRDPRDPATVTADFVAWIERFPRPRAFAARPLLFDGRWIDEYLRTYAGQPLVAPPWDEAPLFSGAGIDIASVMAGVLGRPWREALPAGWLGDVPHSHAAIDDALGYAHLLLKFLKLGAANAPVLADLAEQRS